MKKYKIILVVFSVTILVGIVSCKKSFFDAAPQDGRVSDASSYKTKEDFDKGVIGAYVDLQSTTDRALTIPGFASLDIVNGEGNAVPYDRIFDPNSSLTFDYYRNYYRIIANANVVIDKLDNIGEGILTPDQKSKTYGQVKFLRGYAYSYLTQCFGDIPMVLKPYSELQTSISCTKSDDVWKQVIADLSEAADFLPETKDWTGSDAGRVGKGAALAYLAQAYMYTKDWDKAATTVEKMLTLTKPAYKLFPSVRTVFSAKNRNLDESVFEIQYSPNSADKWLSWGGNTPMNGHTIPTQTAPPGIGDAWCNFGGWGNYILSDKAVASYEPGDDRRKQLLIKYPESYLGELMTDSFKERNWNKWPSTSSSDSFPKNRRNNGYSTKYWFGVSRLPAGENIIMMRFADVKLNYAEILFNKGNVAGAYGQLNDVRTRALLPAKTVSSDPATFMNDLMTERRAELMLEPNLWWHYTLSLIHI
jgi:tetratricopeptide (TPR) repeat protein